MSIRTLKLSFRFAILALLAGFSFSAHATLQWATTTTPACNSGDPMSTTQCYAAFTSTVTDQRAADHIANLSCNGTTCSAVGWITASPSGSQYTVGLTASGSCPTGTTLLSTGECGMSCPAGQTYATLHNECEPTSCPAGQVLFQTVGASGFVASSTCVPQVNAGSPQSCATYADMQTSYCQQQSATCTASGGAYGSVGAGSSQQNVCVPANYGGPALPTCASGGTQFQMNSDGSKSATCIGTPNIGPSGTTASADPAGVSQAANGQSSTQMQQGTQNNTAAIAAISAAGFQAMVNAINNNTAQTKPSSGGSYTGSSAAQDQSNTAGIISAINANTASEHGAGVCDPHAANYAQCIGQTSAAPDTDGSGVAGTLRTKGSGILDSATTEITNRVTNRAQATSPDGIMTTLKAMLPQPQSCSNIGFTTHGVTFQIDCTSMQTFRDWAAWFLAVMTAFTCFQIMFAPKEA